MEKIKKVIISTQKSDSPQIARIHKEALEGDFLPSLGLNFLNVFYEGIIGEEDVYLFAYKEKKRILGFVLGVKDSKRFFPKAVQANFLKLSLLLLLQIIKNPKIIKNIAETFLYPSKDVGSKAELVVIAVDNKLQGRGVGKKLVKVLETAFRKNKIKRYKLTIHADKKAVGFYEHLQFSRISSFKLYGKMWFIYEKKI